MSPLGKRKERDESKNGSQDELKEESDKEELTWIREGKKIKKLHTQLIREAHFYPRDVAINWDRDVMAVAGWKQPKSHFDLDSGAKINIYQQKPTKFQQSEVHIQRGIEDMTHVQFMDNGKVMVCACLGNRYVHRQNLCDSQSAYFRMNIPDVLVSSALAFSHDGEQLACALSSFQRVIIYSTRTGKQTHSFSHNFQKLIHKMVWSPDGKWLACSSRSGLLTVFSIQQLKPAYSYQSFSGRTIQGFTFSHDSAKFALGSEHGDLYVWEVNTWKQCYAKIKTHTYPIVTIHWNCFWFITGDEAGNIHVWNNNSNTRVAFKKYHHVLAIHPVQKLFVTYTDFSQLVVHSL